eukprot:gene17373-biopygen802
MPQRFLCAAAASARHPTPATPEPRRRPPAAGRNGVGETVWEKRCGRNGVGGTVWEKRCGRNGVGETAEGASGT